MVDWVVLGIGAALTTNDDSRCYMLRVWNGTFGASLIFMHVLVRLWFCRPRDITIKDMFSIFSVSHQPTSRWKLTSVRATKNKIVCTEHERERAQ